MSSGRPRRRLVLLILLLIALVVVGLLAIPWVRDVVEGDDGRADLGRAANWLREAPAIRYHGSVPVKEQADAQLDMIISNPGDALGGVVMEGGHKMEYIVVDGQSFLRLDAAAWESAIGLDADRARHFDGKPVTGVEIAFPELANTFAPLALADALSAERTRELSVVSDKPVTISGHRSTPVHVGDMTLYLGERSGQTRAVDRVTLHGVTLDLAMLAGDQARQFYTDFQPKIQGLIDTIDLRIVITPQATDRGDRCEVSSCTVTYRVAVTFLGEKPSTAPVTFTYQFEMDRDGQPSKLGAECSGTLTMRPNESRDLSCTGVNASVPGRTAGKYHSSLRTSEAIFDEAEVDRLLRLATDNREKVLALADRPPR